MITTQKLYELFETDWLMQRQNPGGESVALKGCLLGFNGTVDISEVLKNGKGELKLKIGSGEVQTVEVEFSDVDYSELTPADAVAVFEEAGFSGCTFSVDEETSRLKITPTIETKWLQIYGDLAAALGFGGCTFGEGKGCYLYASLDGDLKSAEETEDWEENKEIVNESPLGSPVKYTTPGKRTGTKIVLTDRISSRAAKQMVIGGTWIPGTVDTPEFYEPPAANDTEIRRVDVYTYTKILDKYNNSAGSEKFIRERMYVGCIGNVKRSGGSGSFNDTEYNLTADAYTGDDGKEHASPRESDYTQAQWDILDLKGIIVTDWENV